MTGYMGLTRLELGFGFQNLDINAGNVTVDGHQLPSSYWSAFSWMLQNHFDTMWMNNPDGRVFITEQIRCSVDHMINVKSKCMYFTSWGR